MVINMWQWLADSFNNAARYCWRQARKPKKLPTYSDSWWQEGLDVVRQHRGDLWWREEVDKSQRGYPERDWID